MRLTEKELLNMHPSWNTKYDIVKCMYGDTPTWNYNERDREQFNKQTGTLANIGAIDNYIYLCNGEYNAYITRIGDVKIGIKNNVLCGSINVKYYGKTYSIDLINMYGKQSLDILGLRKNVVGWCNKYGSGSPASKLATKELDLDIVEKILASKLEDYGEGIQNFMATCREIYNQDKTNYIVDKCFKL